MLIEKPKLYLCHICLHSKCLCKKLTLGSRIYLVIERQKPEYSQTTKTGTDPSCPWFLLPVSVPRTVFVLKIYLVFLKSINGRCLFYSHLNLVVEHCSCETEE